MRLKITIDKNNKITIFLYGRKTLLIKDYLEDSRDLDQKLLLLIDKNLRRVNMKITDLDKVDFLSKTPSFTVNLVCGVIVDNLRFAKKLYT